MSKKYDERAAIKLTNANRIAVDKRAKLESRNAVVKVSRAAMANKAIEVGITEMNKNGH